jgi:putative cell wall-binding protein
MKEIVDSYNTAIRTIPSATRLLFGLDEREVYAYHSTAVIASGDNYPDALAANGLAGYLTNENLNRGDFNAVPVILTKADKLSSQASDLLKGMQVQNAIIMGGTAAITQDVEDAINKMGIGTSRVAGKDRMETSVKALQRINGNWEGRKGTYDLIIAAGSEFADALSISPYAYRMGTPIVLTDKNGKLTDQEVQAIKANDEIREIIIVGGTAAVSDEVMGQIGTVRNNSIGIHYTRLAGADRYDTSVKIAEFEVAQWGDFFNTLWSTARKSTRFVDYPGSIWQMLGLDNGFTFDHVIVARVD